LQEAIRRGKKKRIDARQLALLHSQQTLSSPCSSTEPQNLQLQIDRSGQYLSSLTSGRLQRPQLDGMVRRNQSKAKAAP